jgi:maltose-binding protein MalE
MELYGREVIDAQVDGVDFSDYPDFCDAYFSYALFADTGAMLLDHELEELTEAYPEVVNEMAYESGIN